MAFLKKIYRAMKAAYRKMLKKFLMIVLKANGATYAMQDVISMKNCDFQDDPDFQNAYAASLRQENLPNFANWIIHVHHWACDWAKSLEGDFVECGVNRGRLAMSNIVYVDFKNMRSRTYYLFDTFQGLDKDVSTPQEVAHYQGTYPDCYEFVRDSFKQCPNVRLVRGAVPKTFHQVSIQKVAYLHVDMNSIFPEIETLRFFWPKMVPGGIIILDDYGWPGHEQQKKAMDEFAKGCGVKVLSLPTGQGVILKSKEAV